MASAERSAEARLPGLREDLKLISPQPGDAVLRWLIYDPARHSYFEIDRATFEVLSCWREGMTPRALSAAVSASFGHNVDHGDITELAGFITVNHLSADPPHGDWRQLVTQARAARPGWLKQLAHNYLFFRIPLFQPQAFLFRTLPVAQVFYTRAVLLTVCVLGLAGLYLVSREWDAFLTTFQSFMSLEGAVAFALALLAIKTMHELGHAYTVVRYGGTVTAMGVAFMLLTPMLYTDVTDAWRLSSRRKRLLVGAAGILVELMIACIATFLWAFTPEGMLKGVLFVTATSGWLMSLAINLNPFMRFDGYFLLSDLVGVPNLQPRAFALARWHLREVLFGLGHAPPEVFKRRARGWMIAYAWAVWIYRLILFIGIAIVVYLYFFKLLGVVLFLFEIAYFVVKPIWSEIMEWRKRAPAITRSRRTYITTAAFAALIVMFVTPWSSQVAIPVVLEPVSYQRIFSPQPAEIRSVNLVQGARVARGDVLAVLHSEQLEHEMRIARMKIAATRVRLARLTADATDRKSAVILDRELAAATSELDGLLRRREELTIRSPLDGEVVEVAPWLHPGRSIASVDALATVAALGTVQARGYVGEGDVWRLAEGAKGRFFPDDGARAAFDITMRDIAPGGTATIDVEDLSSVHGGAIESHRQDDGRITPVTAQYRVVMDAAASDPAPEFRVRGIAIVAGQRQSFAARLWRQVVRVLVREGGI
jgi:putative peptide zinc metalloprotease protein